MGKIATFEEIRTKFSPPLPLPISDWQPTKCPTKQEALNRWPNLKWVGLISHPDNKLIELTDVDRDGPTPEGGLKLNLGTSANYYIGRNQSYTVKSGDIAFPGGDTIELVPGMSLSDGSTFAYNVDIYIGRAVNESLIHYTVTAANNYSGSTVNVP